jgi:dopamine beta-monooxygenase
MRHVSVLCAVVLCVALSCDSPATAFQSYQGAIPNGASVMRNGVATPGVGHDNPSGSGPRNSFGSAFAAEGRAWTTGLCQADTDGDGFTNGQELGDPNCVWSAGATPSRTTGISHPAYADSTPSGAAPPPTMPGATPPATANPSVRGSLSAAAVAVVAGTLAVMMV